MTSARSLSSANYYVMAVIAIADVGNPTSLLPAPPHPHRSPPTHMLRTQIPSRRRPQPPRQGSVSDSSHNLLRVGRSAVETPYEGIHPAARISNRGPAAAPSLVAADVMRIRLTQSCCCAVPRGLGRAGAAAARRRRRRGCGAVSKAAAYIPVVRVFYG